MKKLFLILGVVGLFLITGCSLGNQAQDSSNAGKKSGTPKVQISTGNQQIVYNVEIADTFSSRAKGLMERTQLAEDSGMFFVFETAGDLTFWMKNTLIPLDMIFFDSNLRVVHITKNAQPCKTETCETFGSFKPAKYVLEVNGGQSDKKGIKVGDKAELIIN